MTELNGMTQDIAQDNIEELKKLFPEVFTEGKIDFDKFKQVLGEYVEDEKERYNFTWNGKGRALRLAQTPSTGTLRPCKEESKDWDVTQNLYVEGDNLEVLKLLQKSYHNKIKMIYIDPPYNTGNDFVYEDDFSDSIANYKKVTGQFNSEGNLISSNHETSGRYHTDWLNMIYPRIRLARNLLKDDGVIAISIGEEEIENLKKICNEVFGEGNFINSFIVKRRTKSLNSQFETLRTLNIAFEYILLYSKTNKFVYSYPFKKADESRQEGYWNSFWNNADRPTMRYEIAGINIQKGQWKWSKERAYRALANYESFMEKYRDEELMTSFWKENQQRYFNETGFKMEFIKPTETTVKYWVSPSDITIMDTNLMDYYVNDDTGKRNYFFDTVKSRELIEKLVKMCTDEEDIILDFFSGSSTTAHAVIHLNSSENSNRKFIMVQLPELCKEDSDAFREGFPTICELGKRRIIISGAKIREEAGLMGQDLDIGFKVFKLDNSNLKKWNPDYDDLETSLYDSINNYVDGRTEMDVVYEIMIKMGLDLTYPVIEHTISDKKVYEIGNGALMMCLDDEITTDFAQGMIKLKNELAPEMWKVVFKDNGFASDSNKTNIKEILKCAGLSEDAFTTV